MHALAEKETWLPRLGAVVAPNGVRFRVWAPTAKRVEVLVGDESIRDCPMERDDDGYFSVLVPGIGAGTRYRYRVDGQGIFPDPASRWQPGGVHSFSEVVDPTRFLWTDREWEGIRPRDLVIYELHVGTFTPSGTFAGVRSQLNYLRGLGVTAVELMPVADFPGQWNWGYDGVSLFAPARCYGRPDDLRALVDAAHRLGMAVILDVVYNHLGPDGNYLGAYSPFYFTEHHHTPWGKAVNLDGEHSGPVRSFFIENALHWLHEYHLDGLRLDATHALADDGPRHFLGELAASVHAIPGRRRLVVAEDERNWSKLLWPESAGGLGLDMVWADDFHHHVRRRMAGDSDGYFADFTGTVADIADTLNHGFHYRGQTVARLGTPRGSETFGIPPEAFVFCVQNHDQVGNRAMGERLHHQIDSAAYRAAVALLLLAPQTPLLFMGQEWGTSSPFLYFTDHQPELGRLVTKGRREEFKAFAKFSSPEGRSSIPDPQDKETYLRSAPRWLERDIAIHSKVLALHRALLRMRKRILCLPGENAVATALGDSTLILRYTDTVVVVHLGAGGRVELSGQIDPQGWRVALDTEDPEFAVAPKPTMVDLSKHSCAFEFQRSGALVLSRRHAGGQA